MSAVTASLCSTLMFVLFVSADQKTITAESGQDVTLTCRAANNNIRVVNWSRADLGDEHENVLLFRDGHFDPANQHPSFKKRVDLQDRQMKDGDVSLILKDVRTDDDGKYRCYVLMEIETPSWELISIIYLSVSPDKKFITAKSGEDVTLTCRAPNNNNFTVLKWSKADLKPEFVLLYRDERFDPDNQHPSFKNRVDLRDRQMKDGDVSLILKNVTINDNGTYVCRVFTEETNSWDLRSITHLRVTPGHTGGYSVWKTGLIVGILGILLLLCVIFLIYKKKKTNIKRCKQVGSSVKYSQTNSDPAAVQTKCFQRKKGDQGQKETDDASSRVSSLAEL